MTERIPQGNISDALYETACKIAFLREGMNRIFLHWEAGLSDDEVIGYYKLMEEIEKEVKGLSQEAQRLHCSRRTTTEPTPIKVVKKGERGIV